MATSLPSLTETHINGNGNTPTMIELHENTDGSSPTPISTSEGFMYDVFLNFRGADTRNEFTSFLHKDLRGAGLHVYRDDQLPAGEDVLPSLMEAIGRSRVSILVFSPDYASSSSCLQEVAKVKECRAKRRQIVLPIFYKIEPSDVRSQRGPFKRSFRQHRKKRVDPQLLDQWAKALQEIGFLKGYPVWPNVDQGELVGEIVSVVTERLRTGEILVDGNLVGMKRPVQEVVEMLQVDSADVRIVGIYGISGIGKTALAATVYNKIRRDFEGSSFISGIREPDIMNLQSQLISDLRKQKFNRLDSYEANIRFISKRFENMKVLIVLDGVENLDHLKAFCVLLKCFRSGSRIILTTRDVEILDGAGVQNRYPVKGLSEPHALQLFHLHAFQEDSAEEEYRDLSAEIASSTGGIPSIIQLVGSHLSIYRNREKERWEEVLSELKTFADGPLRRLLDRSYCMLRRGYQKIFLDIACFLTGESNTIASYMWRACQFSPIGATDTLVGMSWLKIGENNQMLMSNLIRDYGRSLVLEENSDPEKRSRLWIHKQAMMVLKGNKGSDKIEGMCLEFGNGLEECVTSLSTPTGVHEKVEISPSFGFSQKLLNFLESLKYVAANFPLKLFSSSGEILELSQLMAENFTSLSKLRFLRLDRAKIRGDFGYYLPELRWLDWKSCPEFSQEVRNLFLEKLVILDMSCSDVTNDWSGWNPITERAENLKVLLLAECRLLHESPSFPGCRQLERLYFEGCPRLRNISIPSDTVRTLVYLNLKGCIQITELPQGLCSMKVLETLIIDGTSIKEIIFGREMEKLKEISACSCKGLKIDDSVGNVKSLSRLSLDDTGIEILPASIGSLSNLQTLSLRNCKVKELPRTIGSLTSLVKMDLSYTAINALPTEVKNLRSLRELVMACTFLSEFPETVVQLRRLEMIDFTNCVCMRGNISDDITTLPSLKTLKLSGTAISTPPPNFSWPSQLQVEL